MKYTEKDVGLRVGGRIIMYVIDGVPLIFERQNCGYLFTNTVLAYNGIDWVFCGEYPDIVVPRSELYRIAREINFHSSRI